MTIGLRQETLFPPRSIPPAKVTRNCSSIIIATQQKKPTKAKFFSSDGAPKHTHIPRQSLHSCFRLDQMSDTTLKLKINQITVLLNSNIPVFEADRTLSQLFPTLLAFAQNWIQAPCCSPPNPATFSSISLWQRLCYVSKVTF